MPVDLLRECADALHGALPRGRAETRRRQRRRPRRSAPAAEPVIIRDLRAARGDERARRWQAGGALEGWGVNGTVEEWKRKRHTETDLQAASWTPVPAKPAFFAHAQLPTSSRPAQRWHMGPLQPSQKSRSLSSSPVAVHEAHTAASRSLGRSLALWKAGGR